MNVVGGCGRGALRARLGTAAVLLVSILTACADEVTAPAHDAPQLLAVSTAGVYRVKFIDGRRLPVVVCAGDVKVTVGSLRLRANKTFLASLKVSSPPAALRVGVQETGTYSQRLGTKKIVFQSTSRPGTTWNGTVLPDGSLRVAFPICGETHSIRLFRAP